MSGHSALTIIHIIWSERLGKTRMKALQLSKFGGAFEIVVKVAQVVTSGHTITLLKGELCE